MVSCGCYEYHYRPIDRKRVRMGGGGGERDDEHIAKENKVGYAKVLSKFIIFLPLKLLILGLKKKLHENFF